MLLCKVSEPDVGSFFLQQNPNKNELEQNWKIKIQDIEINNVFQKMPPMEYRNTIIVRMKNNTDLYDWIVNPEENVIKQYSKQLKKEWDQSKQLLNQFNNQSTEKTTKELRNMFQPAEMEETKETKETKKIETEEDIFCGIVDLDAKKERLNSAERIFVLLPPNILTNFVVDAIGYLSGKLANKMGITSDTIMKVTRERIPALSTYAKAKLLYHYTFDIIN